MIIIWSGAGILVPVIFFASVFLAEVLTSTLADTFGIVMSKTCPLVFGLFLTTVALWYFGKYLAKGSKILIDPETNEPVEIRKNHSFFFISVKWWSYLTGALLVFLAILEIILLFKGVTVPGLS